ncbi:MAG: DUF2332 domain-containing protein [Sphingobium sp.]
MSDDLLKAIETQARACLSLGAPFSAGLLEHAGRDIAEGGVTCELLAPWSDLPAEQLIRDAVALRLLASLHHLALDGSAPELAAFYPSHAADPDRAWPVAAALLAVHRERVAAMLTHEPQTNEVRRSACLLGGFLVIARDTGLPLRCFELGASAGLNSLWDRFRYEIRGDHWGDPGSPVVLPCRWDGNAPALDVNLTVAERHACDRKPLDIGCAEDLTRLLSYCWADQQQRMARLRAAIRVAQQARVEVVAAQAAEWVGRAAPRIGTATVVFHSIVWQYIPAAEQSAIEATLRRHAARATVDAPFYWLRMELNEASRKFELRLRTWREWEDSLLATVHPHGEFASWH